MNLYRPERVNLDHSPPEWDEQPEWFITICCASPGKNQLCLGKIGPRLLQAAAFYHERRIWHTELFLLMPDHLHALISVPSHSKLADVIGRWKQWTTNRVGVLWQKNFFDHRLRSYPSANAKFKYIEQNPVRAGLVKEAKDWPYVFYGARNQSAGLAHCERPAGTSGPT